MSGVLEAARPSTQGAVRGVHQTIGDPGRIIVTSGTAGLASLLLRLCRVIPTGAPHPQRLTPPSGAVAVPQQEGHVGGCRAGGAAQGLPADEKRLEAGYGPNKEPDQPEEQTDGEERTSFVATLSQPPLVPYGPVPTVPRSLTSASPQPCVLFVSGGGFLQNSDISSPPAFVPSPL